MGVPDGATAEEQDTGQQDDGQTEEPTDPATPSDQVNAEIARAEVSAWWRSLFGLDEHEAGGGGTGGQFMFASVDELTGVITQWELERDAIIADRDAIADAYYQIGDPAGDDMSRGQASASRDSLATMWEHNVNMLKYAEDYISKLYASRDQMSTMEDGAVARMRSVQA